MTPDQIFKSFSGKWNLKRVLGTYGVIEGLATFSTSCDKGFILYREDFNISNFNQNSMHSHKEYEYQFNCDKIVKYFKSENVQRQIFYELKFLSNNLAVAKHVCKLDSYDVEYNFKSLCNFRLKYTVRGPNKNYVIETEFTKILAI